MVEFALVIPLVLMLILATIELGLVAAATITINTAMRGAGLQAARSTQASAADCAADAVAELEREIGKALLLRSSIEFQSSAAISSFVDASGRSVRNLLLTINADVPCLALCWLLLDKEPVKTKTGIFNYVRTLSFPLESQEKCL